MPNFTRITLTASVSLRYSVGGKICSRYSWYMSWR